MEAAAAAFGAVPPRRVGVCFRDFIDDIQRSRGGISKKLCAFIVRLYERARFSDDEITRKEFVAYRQKLKLLLSLLDPQYHDTDN